MQNKKVYDVCKPICNVTKGESGHSSFDANNIKSNKNIYEINQSIHPSIPPSRPTNNQNATDIPFRESRLHFHKTQRKFRRANSSICPHSFHIAGIETTAFTSALFFSLFYFTTLLLLLRKAPTGTAGQSALDLGVTFPSLGPVGAGCGGLAGPHPGHRIHFRIFRLHVGRSFQS